MSLGGLRFAVDIGGTFTDSVVLDDHGNIRSAKTLSVPGQQDSSVFDNIDLLDLEVSSVARFVHGTTVGLNALLERRGPKLALLVTKGFRDVYEIGRASRPEMYNIHYRRPERFLQRRDVFEVGERVLVDGTKRTPLDERDLEALADELNGRYESIAICFLHSYRWPEHERRAKQILESLLGKGVSVVASHEVAPEWREYERTSTTVVSAYVTPATRKYLSALESRLRDKGLDCPLHVMQSNGGVTTAGSAMGNAIQTLFSGPVGGAIACQSVGSELGLESMICVDMGGTSFDVSLVAGSRAEVLNQTDIEGHPLLSSSVAIHSLGAGGGSIIGSESGGLRVGPESAGASPGPACYGQGGQNATVTDANVLLGRIPSGLRLGGSLQLDRDAAERSLEQAGESLGLSAIELARGALDVVNAMMADGIREVTVARGIDPRQYDLLAFGGAGPLHAAFLADELDIEKVVIPVSPGVFSAYGMLGADIRHDLVQSAYGVLDDQSVDEIGSAFETLEEEGRAALDRDGVLQDSMSMERSLEMRYAGQEYSIVVAVGELITAESLQEAKLLFHEEYLQVYGHNNRDESVEYTGIRMTALGRIGKPEYSPISEGETPSPTSRDMIDIGNGLHETPVFDRHDLRINTLIDGPAIVYEDECTTCIPNGWQATLDPRGHMILQRK